MTNKLALIVAVVLGVLSILGIKAYVDRVKDDDAIRGDKITVFVAAQDVEKGRAFTEDDLEETEFPRVLLEQALRGTWVTDKQTILGVRTMSRIKTGQVLVMNHFARGTPKPPQRLKFLPTQRAVSISISQTGGLAGHLRPQDLVDLIVSMRVTDTAGRSVQLTTTLLKRVQILAVGTNLDPSVSGNYSTLTLALSPEDTQTLLFAVSQGAAVQCGLTMPDTPKSEGLRPMKTQEFWDRVHR